MLLLLHTVYINVDRRMSGKWLHPCARFPLSDSVYTNWYFQSLQLLAMILSMGLCKSVHQEDYTKVPKYWAGWLISPSINVHPVYSFLCTTVAKKQMIWKNTKVMQACGESDSRQLSDFYNKPFKNQIRLKCALSSSHSYF